MVQIGLLEERSTSSKVSISSYRFPSLGVSDHSSYPGVNDYTNNQATIHTNPGCNLQSTSPNTLGISGTVVGGTNCAAAQTGNQGCGVRAAQSNSFGAAFNDNGGGVYASQFSSFQSLASPLHVLTARKQCNGIATALPCTSSLVTLSLQTSRPMHLSLKLGGNQ
jgi:hypothetical protein